MLKLLALAPHLFSPLVTVGASVGQEGWGGAEGGHKGVDELILEMLVNALLHIHTYM